MGSLAVDSSWPADWFRCGRGQIHGLKRWGRNLDERGRHLGWSVALTAMAACKRRLQWRRRSVGGSVPGIGERRIRTCRGRLAGLEVTGLAAVVRSAYEDALRHCK